MSAPLPRRFDPLQPTTLARGGWLPCGPVYRTPRRRWYYSPPQRCFAVEGETESGDRFVGTIPLDRVRRPSAPWVDHYLGVRPSEVLG